MNLVNITLGENVVSLQNFLYNHVFASFMYSYNASLAWAVATAAIWVFVMIILYRKKIFIKL